MKKKEKEEKLWLLYESVMCLLRERDSFSWGLGSKRESGSNDGLSCHGFACKIEGKKKEKEEESNILS